MKNHTKFCYAQDVFNDVSGSFAVGFNRRISSEPYTKCFQYQHEQTDGALHSGWNTAERLINEGKIYYKHNFHHTHGDCPKGYAFQYGGFWVCNTCGGSGVDKPWWNIKVSKDGNAWMCAGEGFANLQESENYAFGSTRDDAIKAYGDLMLKSTQPIKQGDAK